MALAMFSVAHVAFSFKRVRAFDMTAIYDDGGTKVANDGSLAGRILRSLLGKSGRATRAMFGSLLLCEKRPQMHQQYKWLHVMHHQ